MAADAVVHLFDDDDGVWQALSFLLTSSGFAVRVFESASAFLEAISKLQPGCIVTDVRMPGISGLELQRQLKASQVTAGYCHNRTRRRCPGRRGDEGRRDRLHRKAVHTFYIRQESLYRIVQHLA